MVESTLAHSLEPALNTWEQLVADGPDGPGIDFSDTNRTRLCRRRFQAFLDDPSMETFQRLWNADSLAGYWAPNAASLLQPDDAVESLQTLFSEIATADDFNPAWEGRFWDAGTPWGLYELYGRLQGGHEPIPSIEAKRVLKDLGYDVGDGRDAVIAEIRRFADTYKSHVGHVSQETNYELPVYAEIDEFFRLVEATDRDTINAQLTGPYAPLFRPLIGYRSIRGRRNHSAGAVLTHSSRITSKQEILGPTTT